MSQAKIWNRFAKGYAKRPVGDPQSYARKLEMTAQRLTPEMRLLEVGCGTGTTALKHAPRVAHIDAVDFSSAMIAIARQKAQAEGVTNVDFRVSAIDDLPIDARYDAVLALSVLHLLPDPGAALKRLAAMVTPRGYVITSTTCIGDMGGILASILPALALTRVIPSVKALKKSDLMAIHEAAELEILEEFRPGPDKAVFLIAQRPH